MVRELQQIILAASNEVFAIEPSQESIDTRWHENQYTQVRGSIECLNEFRDEFFDIIICHNVLEYAHNRDEIVKEFHRVLKEDGYVSLVKHNRPGRVMQMVVLLNDFEQANGLLDGNDGMTSQFGSIRYYEDQDIMNWCNNLSIQSTMGIRTFWDLQQNQEIQKDNDWQQKMIEIEMRVSELDEYQWIAFFHHLIIRKNK